MRVFLVFFLVLAATASATAEEAAPSVRVTVNGETITSESVEARQYDLIGKQRIVTTVLDEARMVGRLPAVAQDLKGLLAAVAQQNPEASRAEIVAKAEAQSVVYTQTLAVRRVKPKLFAEVEAQAIEQLIEEQLMLQEGTRQSIVVDEAEVDRLAMDAPRRAGDEGEVLHKLLVAWDKRALTSVKARIRADLVFKQAMRATQGSEASDADAKRVLSALRQSATIARP